MFNPPEELHTRFDAALAKVKANLGKEYGMIIDGKDVLRTKNSKTAPLPIRMWCWAFSRKGAKQDAQDALAAARKAFPSWSRMKWQDRVALLRKAADLIGRAHLRDLARSWQWKWARTAWNPWAMWLRPPT